jgi:hypothetical protein
LNRALAPRPRADSNPRPMNQDRRGSRA